MKKYLLIAAAFSLLVFSCPDEKEDKRSFWAQDAKGKNYQVQAELLAAGIYCNVWVDVNAGVDVNTARMIAQEYDKNIYLKMMPVFGFPALYSDGKKVVATNTMQLADWLGDGDGKLCILLLDIKDDYNPPSNTSYIAGYFWGGDLLTVYNSNSADMIYIDTYPGFKNMANLYRTLAHEMQHMINFALTIANRKGASMDTWIDEGLSSAAEYIVYGPSENRLKDYNNSDLIKKGNNFFVWNNRYNAEKTADGSPVAVLDDYATVYLFFQWLRIQSAKGTEIYKDIIGSAASNYTAVTAAAKNINSDYGDWGNLLRDWLAANQINNATGPYGYKGEEAFSEIAKHYVPGTSTNIQLFPGEGVYSYTTSNPGNSPNGNINYHYLDTVPYLLTYNVNVNYGTQSEKKETGTVTGIAPPSVNIISQGSRSALSSSNSGPSPVSMGDLRGRNGYQEQLPYGDFPLITILEQGE